jgi:spore germination cell wall hydrolase CwlJ-like protein
MRAVAHVIDNRVKSLNDKQYGKTLREVVTRDFQFSAWNTGDPNLTKMTVVDALDPNSEDWAQWIVAQRIAEDVLTGRSTDPIEGRRFYHSVSVQPSWAAYGTGPKRVGQHIFYYDASLPG